MGHAGFMAIGAYTSALVVKIFGFLLYRIVMWGHSGYDSRIIDWIFYITTSGDYFVIATLGLGEVVKLAIENLHITGGVKGLSDVAVGTTFSLVLVLNIVIIILLVNF